VLYAYGRVAVDADSDIRNVATTLPFRLPSRIVKRFFTPPVVTIGTLDQGARQIRRIGLLRLGALQKR
jgi:hypothetical protein